MLFKAVKNQTSYGEAIGILLLDSFAPFIQGDVGNARSFPYPVRYHRVDGLTVERIFAHDRNFVDRMIEGARQLEREGVKAITGDCGFMAIYQKEVKQAVGIPVLLSSLLQIPFIQATLPGKAQVGILTANSRSLTPDVLTEIGIAADASLIIQGLENCPYFSAAAIEETGELDSDRIREEVVATAIGLVSRHPAIRALLLECSMLPPYAAAVQEATGLPVYDFLTMIDHAQAAVVRKRFADTI